MTQQVDITVLVDPEDKEVYVKFSGFEHEQDADEYAEFLIDYLSLMLFESETKH